MPFTRGSLFFGRLRRMGGDLINLRGIFMILSSPSGPSGIVPESSIRERTGALTVFVSAVAGAVLLTAAITGARADERADQGDPASWQTAQTSNTPSLSSNNPLVKEDAERNKQAKMKEHQRDLRDILVKKNPGSSGFSIEGGVIHNYFQGALRDTPENKNFGSSGISIERGVVHHYYPDPNDQTEFPDDPIGYW